MMLTKKWTKNFDKKDILNTIDKFGPVNSIYSLSEYSLAWFIELIFRNSKGKPMRLLPYQSVALNMLWHKKFPMLLMSRGGGKCQSGNTMVQTSKGMFRFDELISPSSPEMTELPIDMEAIGENGSNKIAYGWNNGFRNTKKIITDFGFECENTLEHKIRVLRNGKIEWVESKDIVVGDRVPIVCKHFEFGKNNLMSPEEAFNLGSKSNNETYSTGIPINIRSASRNIVESYIDGLLSSAQVEDYYIFFSEELARQVQVCLLSFGIIYSRVGSKLVRRDACDSYFYDTVTNIEDGYCQTYDIHVPNDHTFIANGFISHNTFLLAIYSLLKALLIPGSKIVICGAGFRQSKMVFKEIEKIYNASPLVQECCKDRPKYASDAAYLNVGHSTITAIPIGDGEKIRGTRATTLICDEFASISEEIFEIVISPFTAVHVDPAERAIVADFAKRLRDLKISKSIIEKIEESQGFGNQIVIAGTASYKHNHFYKRYKTYKAYIDSQGDIAKLKKSLDNISLEITGQGTPISEEEMKSLAKMWKHYSILQLPYTAIPAGVMDEDSIRANKAKIPYYRFAMEYLVQFPDDSDGFIKRSWIEESTPRLPHNDPVNIELYGDPRATYVMGLDPARHNDNFGCVVLKITPRGKEVVYCNAWNRTEYGESSRIILEICKRFNVQYIAMDSGGGGWAVSEWLAKETKDVRPEDLILLVPDQLQEKNIKLLSSPGKKILEMVNFSPSWTSEAAHALAASIQQKNLLFPYSANDELCYRQYMSHFNLSDISDSEKELVSSDLWGKEDWELSSKSEKPIFGIKQHIDECVNEVCAIIREVTPGGVEKFELPSISDQPEGLDMRRRDRFSALMLANYAAKVYASFGSRIVSSRGVSSGHNKRRTLANSFRKRGSVYY